MGKINNFQDLDAWQEAHKLVSLIYKYTELFPKTETFGLTSQLRRAAISITANIAEGFSRYHYKDRLRFYYDARGSISEVQSELLDAYELGFITSVALKEASDKTEHISIILGGLIRKTTSLSKIPNIPVS